MIVPFISAERTPIDPHQLSEKAKRHNHARNEQGYIRHCFHQRQADIKAGGDGFYEKIIHLRIKIRFEKKRHGKRS